MRITSQAHNNNSNSAATTGIQRLANDPPSAAIFSLVATAALPMPAVVLVLNKRNIPDPI